MMRVSVDVKLDGTSTLSPSFGLITFVSNSGDCLVSGGRMKGICWSCFLDCLDNVFFVVHFVDFSSSTFTSIGIFDFLCDVGRLLVASVDDRGLLIGMVTTFGGVLNGMAFIACY